MDTRPDTRWLLSAHYWRTAVCLLAARKVCSPTRSDASKKRQCAFWCIRSVARRRDLCASVHKRGIRLRIGCGRRPRPGLLRPRTQRSLCLWHTRACALHHCMSMSVCLHRHRACARWSRLPSMRSQPSSCAADRVAPAISGSGASARQTMEANKGAVGVAMQYLVMIDKLHDMHERQVISDLHFAQWSDWACEHVTSMCS